MTACSCARRINIEKPVVCAHGDHSDLRVFAPAIASSLLPHPRSSNCAYGHLTDKVLAGAS